MESEKHLGSGLSDSILELQMLRLPQYHMEEMVLRTCERYAPAGRSVLHELH